MDWKCRPREGTTNRRDNTGKVEGQEGQDASGSAGRSLAEDAAGGDVWRGETSLRTHRKTLCPLVKPSWVTFSRAAVTFRQVSQKDSTQDVSDAPGSQEDRKLHLLLNLIYQVRWTYTSKYHETTQTTTLYIYILYNITFVPLAIKYVLKIYLIMLRLKMSKYKKYDKKH